MPSSASPTSSSNRSTGPRSRLHCRRPSLGSDPWRAARCSRASTTRSGEAVTHRGRAARHHRRGRLGQDPGAHPPHRLPMSRPHGRSRATCSRSRSPARRPASCRPGSASSACATDVAAGTFHAVAYAQLRRGGPTGACSRPTCSSARVGLLGSPARPHLVACMALDVAGEIEWAKARLVDARRVRRGRDGGAGRRPPLDPARMADLYQRYEDEKRRQRQVDFDDLLRQCVRAHRDRRATSPRRSAGGSGTSSSTSSRTSTLCSSICSTRGAATVPICASSATRTRPSTPGTARIARLLPSSTSSSPAPSTVRARAELPIVAADRSPRPTGCSTRARSAGLRLRATRPTGRCRRSGR